MARQYQPRTRVLEDDFADDYFEPLLKLNGWLYYHTRSSIGSVAGFPDYVCIRREELMVVELKKQDGKVSPDQLVWLAAFENAGLEVHVWRPSDAPEIEERLKRRR